MIFRISLVKSNGAFVLHFVKCHTLPKKVNDHYKNLHILVRFIFSFSVFPHFFIFLNLINYFHLFSKYITPAAILLSSSFQSYPEYL